MEMKIPAIAITALVVIVVLAGVLIPVLDDATAKSDTYVNAGFFYVEDPTEEIVLTLADGVLSVNGESVNPGENETYPDGISVVITENGLFRYYENELRSRGGIIGYHSLKACELTFSSGTITGTYTDTSSDSPTTVSTTYTNLTVIYPTKTDAVMCKPVAQYVHADSVINGAGVISTPSQTTKYWVAEFSGSIEDGITGKLFGQSTGAEATSVSFENAVIHYEEVEDHVDLYKVTSITFDVIGDDATDPITFTIYMTPSEVTADRVDPMPDNQSAILMVIPIMVIVALLVAVVALVFRSREF